MSFIDQDDEFVDVDAFDTLEESVQVAVRWIAPGSRYDQPIHHFDIYGTAAAAAGASLPTDRPIDGKDLLPYIQNQRSEAPHEQLFWRQGHYRVVIADGWKLHTTTNTCIGRMSVVSDS